MDHPANQNDWLISLEKFANVTLGRIKLAAPEWSRQLATAFLDQVNLYGQQPLERGFLFNLIGVSVYHGIIQQGPSYAMDLIMTSVRHQMIEESIGCASAMGITITTPFFLAPKLIQLYFRLVCPWKY